MSGRRRFSYMVRVVTGQVYMALAELLLVAPIGRRRLL